jgi:hypothetical protein
MLEGDANDWIIEVYYATDGRGGSLINQPVRETPTAVIEELRRRIEASSASGVVSQCSCANMSGDLFCTCAHERRVHVYSREARTRVGARAWRQCKHPKCRCIRFAEAPPWQQQLDLFDGDAAARLASEFGRDCVAVLHVGDRL